MLDKMEEYPCPDCGCEDSTRVEVIQWEHDVLGRHACNHCGSAFVVLEGRADSLIAPWQPTRCTHCRSQQTTTYSTPQRRDNKRYHLCRTCKHRFVSKPPEIS